jgi:hypothetical protein
MERAALLIKTWNSFIRNERVAQLKFQKNEAFPIIVDDKDEAIPCPI